MRQILREQPVAVFRPEELPAEAARDAETLRRRGIRSNLAIPLVAGVASSAPSPS
jgi:hypothetical protein